MDNQKQQQQPDNTDSNKKESTNSGGNEDTPSTSSKPKDILHEDVCSICMDDVSIMNVESHFLCFECGKVMHIKCGKRLLGTKGSISSSCPMCRAPLATTTDETERDIESLQRWSALGKSWAKYNLGHLYERGDGVNKDPKRAFELWKSAADHGYHLAQFCIGNMYAWGQGVTQSDSLSFKYYKLCADQGYADAQTKVGYLYDKGIGVEQSDTETCRYYTLAADQGDHIAQHNLGNLYLKGQGVILSDPLAFKFYKLSAEQGFAEAQFNVGAMYLEGKGVTQSFTEARVWWTKAAKQGHDQTIKHLKILDEKEGIKTTSSYSNFTDNSTVLCSKCNKPAQTERYMQIERKRPLQKCKCQGAQYCNGTCQHAHWIEHKAEHNRLIKLLASTGETKESSESNKSKTKKQKPNERCACGSKKKYKKCCGSKKR